MFKVSCDALDDSGVISSSIKIKKPSQNLPWASVC
jgi:hypothetical protein